MTGDAVTSSGPRAGTSITEFLYWKETRGILIVYSGRSRQLAIQARAAGVTGGGCPTGLQGIVWGSQG